MFEIEDKAIAAGATVAAGLAALMYSFYKKQCKTAFDVQATETVKIGKGLKNRLGKEDGHRIPYAAVHGFVNGMGKVFRGENSSKEGVILKNTLVEHKSKRTQGVWSDGKNVILDNLEVSTFALFDLDNPGYQVQVEEPTEAHRLLQELEITHHEFKPHKTSAMQAGLDRLFGEVCRGYEKTEEMLVVGTGLMGFGEIYLENNSIKIRAPQMEDKKYILTTMSKKQLLKFYKSQATIFKVLGVVFGIVAVGLIGSVIWRATRKFLECRRTQRQLEELRAAALQGRALGRKETNNDPETACVVCLTNPREVVILDCGHIALCADCAQVLPQPQTCPVCREPVAKFLPVYHS